MPNSESSTITSKKICTIGDFQYYSNVSSFLKILRQVTDEASVGNIRGPYGKQIPRDCS